MSIKERLIVQLALLNPCLYSNGKLYKTIIKLCKLDCECCSYLRAMVIGWLFINTGIIIAGILWKLFA